MKLTDDNQIYICSFYSDKFQYRFAAHRLRNQITKLPFVIKSFLYSEIQLFNIIENKYTNLLENFKSEKSKPGFAWFAWKPIVILNTLNKVPDGSVLLYLDIGCNLNASDNFWNNLISRNKSNGIVTAYSKGVGINQFGSKEITWTKNEVFEKLMISTVDKNSPQYQATWIMMINNENCRLLIQEWIELCTVDNFSLIKSVDKNALQSSNFVRHSHDQSIFSCLLKKNKIVPAVASKDDMSIISASRNLSVFSFHESNFFYKTLKLGERFLIKFLNMLFYKNPNENLVSEDLKNTKTHTIIRFLK